MVPILPHEIWPAATYEDRICGSCIEVHDYEQHIARNGAIPFGEKGCPCKDFRCYEHPDGECVGEP